MADRAPRPVGCSGNYRRGFSAEGRHYSHGFDPATGCPIVNGVSSVAAVHRDLISADSWATAMTVLEPKDADAERLAVCVVTGHREHISRARGPTRWLGS